MKNRKQALSADAAEASPGDKIESVARTVNAAMGVTAGVAPSDVDHRSENLGTEDDGNVTIFPNRAAVREELIGRDVLGADPSNQVEREEKARKVLRVFYFGSIPVPNEVQVGILVCLSGNELPGTFLDIAYWLFTQLKLKISVSSLRTAIAELERDDLVERSNVVTVSTGRGRNPIAYRLTAKGERLYDQMAMQASVSELAAAE